MIGIIPKSQCQKIVFTLFFLTKKKFIGIKPNSHYQKIVFIYFSCKTNLWQGLNLFLIAKRLFSSIFHKKKKIIGIKPSSCKTREKNTNFLKNGKYDIFSQKS